MFEKPKIGQELLDVPMGDMIQQMAFAIAEAQRRLDENSIDTAQMMGGLETITDETTGEVTFSDSRVFFGKEKFALVDAIAAHNQTGDLALRANIRQAIGSSNYTEPEIVNLDGIINLDSLATLSNYTETTNDSITDNLHDPSKIYKIDTGTNQLEYYRYIGAVDPAPPAAGPRTYQQVSEFSANIVKVGALPDNHVFYVPSRVSMLELGFTPTFYQFVDTIIEVKISIKYTQDGAVARNQAAAQVNSAGRTQGLRGLIFGGRRSSTVTTAHVNATYSQKFSYSAEGSSLLRTKLVPIPPPPILEERIRLQMDILREEASPSTTTTTA